MSNEIEVPPLGAIMAYRGVHALCTVAETGMLKATHYATCLIGGRDPMWGVWNVNGTFQRFFGSKAQIAEAYKNLTWRRKNATWSLVDIHTKDVKVRREELRKLYRRGKLLNGSSEPVAALFEQGVICPWHERSQHQGEFQPLYAAPSQEVLAHG